MIRLTLSAILFACLALPSFAQTSLDILAVPAAGRVTLSQALELGRRNNPQNAIARYSRESARANLISQRAPLNPTISYGAPGNNFASPNGYASGASYGLIATVETSGRQVYRTRQAKAVLRQADADADTASLGLTQTIASAYIDLQAANDALAVERDAFTVAQRLADLTEKQVTLGAVPRTNALRSRIALAQEETNLTAAVTAVGNARAALNNALGQPTDAPIDAADPLVFTPVSVDRATIARLALDRRPELRSGIAQRDAARAAALLARSQYYPDLVMGRDLQGPGDIQVGLLLPLWDFGGVRGAVAKANADSRTQEAQNEQQRQAILLGAQVAYNQFEQGQRQIISLRDGALPQAESLLSRVEQGYRLGASTILDLIDAQSTYRTIRAAYSASIANYRRAVVGLERAAGAPVSDLSASNPVSNSEGSTKP